MYNKKEILKNVKLYGSIGLMFIFSFFIFQYNQLIGFTKIKNVRIFGNEFIPKSIIEEFVEITPSSDLLFFNVSQIQEKINNIDYISSCRVSRIFPSTLIIEIIENKPLAHVKTYENEFIIDKNGSSLPISNRALNYFSIPKLNYNIDLNDSKNINFSINEFIGHELNFLKNEFPHFYNKISIIDYFKMGDVKIKFFTNTEIFVKEDKLDIHFKILDEFKNLNMDFKHFSLIDLRVNNQLIVKENKL